MSETRKLLFKNFYMFFAFGREQDRKAPACLFLPLNQNILILGVVFGLCPAQEKILLSRMEIRLVSTICRRKEINYWKIIIDEVGRYRAWKQFFGGPENTFL